MGVPLAEILNSEARIAQAVRDIISRFERFSGAGKIEATAEVSISAGSRSGADRWSSVAYSESRFSAAGSDPRIADSSRYDRIRASEDVELQGVRGGRHGGGTRWKFRWPFSDGGGANDPVVSFYRGTTAEYANVIRKDGVSLTFGSSGPLDFGRGFYTSRDLSEANKWSQNAVNKTSGEWPGLVEFRVPSSELSKLAVERFTGADTRWSSFIANFGRGQARSAHSFDVVEGPVLSNMREYSRGGVPRGRGTQTSWHTQAAINVLNAYIVRLTGLPVCCANVRGVAR